MEKDTAASPPNTMKAVIITVAIGIGLVGFWLTSRVSYLLFHSLAELFSVLVAWGIFIVAWNSRRFIAHSFFLFLGVAFLAVGALDLLHMLTYKGLGVFPGATADLPTQLWIAARGLEAVSLLMAPLFLTRRARAMKLLSAYGLATGLLVAMIFGEWFPACFVEGQGLTAFKIISEYLICVLLAAAIVFVYRRGQHLDQLVLRLVIAALSVSIVSELSFTLYVDVYGLFNQVGHFLKIIVCVLLYKAIIETGLQRPYRTLFRELAQSEERYRKLFDTMTEGFAIHEIICDDQGRPCDYRFLQVNPAFERMTGLKAADLVGRTLYEVLPQSESLWVERYGAVALTGQPAHFEAWSEALDRHFEVSAFQTERGCFGVVFLDVSERKRVEKELRQSRNELEIRVLERTAELAQINEELTIEIAERLKIEQALQKSKKQLQILASQILSAQESERKRVALEVHDVLGSSLSAIKFKAEEALGHLTKDGTLNRAISKPLETLIPLIKETIEEARRIQTDLRPPLLDDLGILATLSWFCRRFKTVYSRIEIEQEITVREEEIPDQLKIALFRITQEAMNNIGKHAKADSVYLGLRKIDGAFELCIKDNGEGFDSESLSSREISKKGLGLSSMKERIEFSGGSFSIDSFKGKGTVIRAVWPI